VKCETYFTGLDPRPSTLITTARECLTAQPLTLLPAFWIVTVCAALATFLGLVLFRLAMPHLIVRMGG
jgi:hypothetical protein